MKKSIKFISNILIALAISLATFSSFNYENKSFQTEQYSNVTKPETHEIIDSYDELTQNTDGTWVREVKYTAEGLNDFNDLNTNVNIYKYNNGNVNIDFYEDSFVNVELCSIEFDLNWLEEDQDDGWFESDAGHSDIEPNFLLENPANGNDSYLDGKYIPKVTDNPVPNTNDVSSPSEIDPIYFIDNTHSEACHNKLNKIKTYYDEDGYIHISESDRDTNYMHDYSKLDYHKTLDTSSRKHYEERLKCQTVETAYTFKINYKDEYDISNDVWSGDWKNNTQENLLPTDKLIYTSANTYADVEEDLRNGVRTETWNESNTLLPENIGIRFFPSYEETDVTYDVINPTTEHLSSNKIYVEFYPLESNENETNIYYSHRRINEYEIPYLESYNYDFIYDGEHDHTSLGNKSAFYQEGTIDNNNVEIYLNTGAIINIYDEAIPEVENLKTVSIKSGSGEYEVLWDDSDLNKPPICSVEIGELGNYQLKIEWYDTLWPKNKEINKGEEDNELVIDIHVSDGQSYFDNNDIQDANGDNINHEYAIYYPPSDQPIEEINGELYEYYKSDNTFMLNSRSCSQYLFGENYLYRGDEDSDKPYFGSLEKATINESTREITWTEIEPESGERGEFCKDPSGVIRIGLEGENSLYKYTIKDVFGYEYDYYLETNIGNRDELFDYDSVYQNYLETPEGVELLAYIMYNNTEVTDELYVGDHFNHLQIEENRSVLTGKRNLKYYQTNDTDITNAIGKIEYGTKYEDIADEVDDIVLSDLEREGYNTNDLEELERGTDLNTEIKDATELYYNIKGKKNSSVYGEINIKVIPSVIRNLSLIKIDNNSLSNLTGTIPEDVSFAKDMRPKLESNIFSQLMDNEENRYFNITQDVDHNKDMVKDIKIKWYLPYNAGDYAKYGTTIRYEISSTNPDYYFNTYSGSFTSKAYFDLSRMNINNTLIQKETILFKSGTKFRTIQPKLEKAIKNSLSIKLINPNNIGIDWYVEGKAVNDNTIVHNDDIIGYTLYNNGNSNRFKYTKEGEFESMQYVDISDITIDTVELQQSLNLSYGGSEFSVIKDSLEENIRLQISEQIGEKYTEFVDISWLTGDDEILYAGKEISFKLESNNLLRVHNSDNKYTIQYNEVEVPSKLTFIDILLIMIILLTLCVILFIIIKLIS